MYMVTFTIVASPLSPPPPFMCLCGASAQRPPREAIYKVLHEVAPCLHMVGRDVGRAVCWWARLRQQHQWQTVTQQHPYLALNHNRLVHDVPDGLPPRVRLVQDGQQHHLRQVMASIGAFALGRPCTRGAGCGAYVTSVVSGACLHRLGKVVQAHQAAQGQHEGEGVDGARLHLRRRDVRLRQGQRRLLRNHIWCQSSTVR